MEDVVVQISLKNKNIILNKNSIGNDGENL